MPSLPSHARAVIVGGGIMGCSLAYHLAREGWREVVLLERRKLTSGSTFHAAGLVGQLRTNANITQLLKHSVELYDRLEAETGQASGWKRNGGLRLACTADRMVELRRQATTARSFGLEMHLCRPPRPGTSGRRWTAPTWSAPPSCRPTARPTPRTSPRRLAKGARQQGAHDRRGLRGHRLPQRRGARRRRGHGAGRDRLRGRGAVRRPMVEGARARSPACACR